MKLCQSVTTAVGAAIAVALVHATSLHAQQTQQAGANRGTITGLVRDAETGTPLSNAGVQVAGTALGGSSNAEGRYTITGVPAGIHTLTIKRIGYSPTTAANVRVVANQTTTSDIALSSQALILTSVVSTGLSDPTSGTRAPFSVANVGQEQLQVSALGSPISALVGKVAGLSISTLSGSPNSDVVIQIRNPLSFSGNTQPMIIIDGVIQMQDDPTINARSIAGNPLDINPEMIESIEVVRGAAAAALYGQKAANGVINITTKRGSDLPAGVTRFQLTQESGFSRVAQLLPNAQHHRFLVDENNQFIDGFGRPVTDRNFVNDPDQIVDNAWGVPTFDNYSALFRTGQTLRSDINLSQSSLATNFSVSMGASHESGVLSIPGGGFGRQNIGMNLDHRAGSSIQAALGLFYNRQFQRFIANGNDVFSAVRDISPDINVRALDPATRDYIPFPDDTDEDRFNPLYFEPKRDSWEKRIGVQANASASFRPVSILSFSASGGYGRSDRESQAEFTPPGELSPDPDDGRDPGTYEVSADLDETFNTNLGANLLTGMGGVTLRSRFSLLGTVEKRFGFGVEAESLFQSGPDVDFARRDDGTSTKRDIRTLGVLGNVALDYNAKYILDLVYRRDGSSLLPPVSRWRSNGRASLAWSMTEEPWWPAPSLTLFKPRYSIGTAGNNPVFNAQYETYLRNQGTERVFKQNMGNTAIKPEDVTEQELGLDMTVNNKYALSFTYVRNYVKDAIRADTISSYTGFDTQQKNLGDLEGTSYEATLESQWINRRDFRWSSTLVLDRSRQKIASYPRRCAGANTNTTLERECEGYVFGQMFGTLIIRDKSQLNPIHITNGTTDQFDINDDGLVVAVGENGSWTDMRWGETVEIDGVDYAWGMPLRAGVYDVDGDRTGNATVPLGQGLPKFNYGLGNQITLGNWTGHMQIVGQVGGLIFNREAMSRYDLGVHEDVDQTGKPIYAKKPFNYYDSGVTGSSGAGGLTMNGTNANNWFVEDGGYLKVSELRVSYRLDAGLPILRRIGMTSGQIAVAARNLFTISGYSGIDPQIGGSDNATTARVDNTSYPRYRSFTAQLRLIF